LRRSDIRVDEVPPRGWSRRGGDMKVHYRRASFVWWSAGSI